MEHLKRLVALAFCLMSLSGCSTIHRIETTTLPSEEVATLSIPNLVWVGKVDGKEASNPLCTGMFCSAGIEIALTPGEHEVEVRYASGYSQALSFTPLKFNYEKGGKYKLVYLLDGGRVRYRIDRQ